MTRTAAAEETVLYIFRTGAVLRQSDFPEDIQRRAVTTLWNRGVLTRIGWGWATQYRLRARGEAAS